MMPMDDENTVIDPITGQPMSAPPIGELMGKMNSTPPTDYNFYKDVSAMDRKKLYEQLTQRQNGAGSMIASGFAGLGDAISNSYGGKNTTFQKDVMADAAADKADQLGAMDTERSQRMADMQGNQAAQENDPNSPLSVSMREIAKSQGVPVPSGMNASVMMKVLGPLGELAMKQANLGIQKGAADESARHNKVAEDQASANAANDKTSREKEDARKAAEDKRQALESAGKEGPIDRFFNPNVGNELDKLAGIKSPTGFVDKAKQAKYEMWKAYKEKR